MSASFYDLLKYAKTGIASPEMTAYDKMLAMAAAGGGAIKTLTGVPPLSFKADGTPLISWSMLGNAQQTGTPTPDAPIQPEFVGIRTRNLCPMIFLHSGVGDDVGSIVTMSTRLWSSKIAVLPSQSYYAMINGEAINHEVLLFNRIVQYDANGEFISRISVVNQKEAEITTAENCRFVVLDIRTRTLTVDITTEDITAVMLSAGSQASYEPFGWAEKITCAGQTVPVYLGQTQTVRRIKKLVLTGDENWQIRTDGTYIFYLVLSTMKIYAPCRSSHYKYMPRALPSTMLDGEITTGLGAGVAIWIKSDAYTTSADFKVYLAQQYANGTPVTIWYILATPETAVVNEPLAKIGDYADELHSEDAGVIIPTAKGQNTLTVETELQPSEMTITYK